MEPSPWPLMVQCMAAVNRLFCDVPSHLVVTTGSKRRVAPPHPAACLSPRQASSCPLVATCRLMSSGGCCWRWQRTQGCPLGRLYDAHEDDYDRVDVTHTDMAVNSMTCHGHDDQRRLCEWVPRRVSYTNISRTNMCTYLIFTEGAFASCGRACFHVCC